MAVFNHHGGDAKQIIKINKYTYTHTHTIQIIKRTSLTKYNLVPFVGTKEPLKRIGPFANLTSLFSIMVCKKKKKKEKENVFLSVHIGKHLL